MHQEIDQDKQVRKEAVNDRSSYWLCGMGTGKPEKCSPWIRDYARCHNLCKPCKLRRQGFYPSKGNNFKLGNTDKHKHSEFFFFRRQYYNS